MPSTPSLLRHYIDGEFVASAKTFANVSPVDGRTLGQVCEAGSEEVNRAVAAGKAAQAGTWGRTSASERADVLLRIASGIERRFEDFVAAEVADTGRSLQQARTLDVARGVQNFRTFAELVRQAGGEFYEMRAMDGNDVFSYTLRKPHGVVAVISPWNLPLLLLTWKVAPALACGNSIIAKPSEETPSSATLLAEVIDEAGLPKGAFNLVHGFGPDSAGEFLTRHADVDAITFTGESRTGEAIMKAAAEGVRDVSFELGGKNAAVVFADADFDKAVAGVLRSSFTNSGQVCLCSERVYVERPIYERFVAAMKAGAENLKIGYPDEDGVNMGPLISHAHRDKVLAYFDLARAEGATVVSGGGVPRFGDARDGGAYVQPTIWTGLADDARCVREEVFGPVCHIAPFDSEDEVLRRVNDSDYGLCAALWTRDLKRAHALSRRFRVGMVWVNTWFLRDLRTPFGGVGLSGIGREGGRHSLDFYSELTTVCVNP
ncbi:MAG: 2-hydroxymuconic semialdehyde dehydrogenase [Rudaea sp.]|uniref:2-hydroxymuconic semialdehyde dehydrogenase n=1 Tax=unclassified Rudaea TaxID=2627037 RepID=UPI0010F6C3A0|nr:MULTISPECIES: 2-hydroxymuconic semialdehyde dehydrogenase [unclassified Rudaea]MBN8884831.1 2-hydroxymuconic semialdehyde dehydrogenase [Rudaea sp.]MBR0347081.1 2-hydroxymuconic semialdehyde dehydrogenase [Rudaea sp.]